MFTLGLAFFLTCHIMYVVVFLLPVEALLQAPVWAYFLAIPYIVYGILIFRYLAPSLNEQKIPVLIYVIVIHVMGYIALLRLWSYPMLNGLLPFIGTLLFIGSDTLLAIQTFKKKIKYAFFYLMLLYIGAQFLIIQGFVL